MFQQQPIQFDSQVIKINRRNDPQERHLVITASHLYNLKCGQVQRVISAETIEAVVMSKSSYEFVLRVSGGYDYRFESPLRWRVYEEIIKQSEMRGCTRLPLYLVEAATLDGYCRNLYGGGQKTLPSAVDFEFCLNRIISNLLQSDHRVVYIADPHLFEIRPNEFVDLLKLGQCTTLVQHRQTRDKMIRKILPKNTNGASSGSLRRSFSEYQQSSLNQTILFVLENPDSFMVFSRAYRHSLADDLLNYREFTEEEIHSIFSQLLTSLMILQMSEISLDNVLYDDLDGLVLTEFEQLRVRSSYLEQLEMSPEEFGTGKKSATTILWRLGVILYRLTYGVGPLIPTPDRFFASKKLVFDEERRSRISEPLDKLIQELLDFNSQDRMRKYASGLECVPSDIIRHSWFH